MPSRFCRLPPSPTAPCQGPASTAAKYAIATHHRRNTLRCRYIISTHDILRASTTPSLDTSPQVHSYPFLPLQCHLLLAHYHYYYYILKSGSDQHDDLSDSITSILAKHASASSSSAIAAELVRFVHAPTRLLLISHQAQMLRLFSPGIMIFPK